MKHPSLFRFQDTRGDLHIDCDVAVVGSGAGGATAACEMARGGLDVVLLEEGPLYETEDYGPETTETIGRLMRDGGATATLGRAPVTYLEGRCVGGSTVINGGMCWRTPEKILKRWSMEAGLTDLTPESLEPIFQRVEETIQARRLDPGVEGRNNAIFKAGCDALGYRTVRNIRNQIHCVGTADCVTGCPTGAKQSTLLTYVPRFLAAGGRLYTSCRVDRVCTAGLAVSGVKGRLVDPHTGRTNRRFRVRASVVVLAGGAVQTPLLLLRSQLANSSGQVGRHFTIHPNVKLGALFDDVVNPDRGAHQAWQCREFQDEGILLAPGGVAPPFMAIAFDSFGSGHAEMMRLTPYLATGGVLVDDHAAGRISLGPFNLPLVRYDITAADQAKFYRGVALLAEVYFAAGARRIYLPFHGMAPLEGPDDIRRIFTEAPRVEDTEYFTAHLMGTCRMHVDPRHGVVDSRGKCHDIPNLYIADASVFASPIGVNPMETIMALATRTAFHIIDSWPHGAAAKASRSGPRRQATAGNGTN